MRTSKFTSSSESCLFTWLLMALASGLPAPGGPNIGTPPMGPLNIHNVFFYATWVLDTSLIVRQGKKMVKIYLSCSSHDLAKIGKMYFRFQNTHSSCIQNYRTRWIKPEIKLDINKLNILLLFYLFLKMGQIIIKSVH